jgi:hypothetical protein
MTPSRRRRKAPGATSRGGWGNAHQRRRAAIAPLVNAGEATCARCHEQIHAGEEWHLDHNGARDGSLGVSATARTRQSLDAAQYVQQPYRWSQRWCDNLPVGTVNLDGGRNPEINVGDGEWQPVDDTRS